MQQEMVIEDRLRQARANRRGGEHADWWAAKAKAEGRKEAKRAWIKTRLADANADTAQAARAERSTAPRVAFGGCSVHTFDSTVVQENRARARATLEELLPRWYHLVTDVEEQRRAVRSGTQPTWDTAYVGRSRRWSIGFGNKEHVRLSAKEQQDATHTALQGEWQRCVDAYTQYIFSPDYSDLRDRIRGELQGRVLVCHCKSRGLPCHASIIAVIANCNGEDLRELRWLSEEHQLRKPKNKC